MQRLLIAALSTAVFSAAPIPAGATDAPPTTSASATKGTPWNWVSRVVSFNGQFGSSVEPVLKEFQKHVRADAPAQLGIAAGEVDQRVNVQILFPNPGTYQVALAVRFDPPSDANKEKITKFLSSQADELKKQVQRVLADASARAIRDLEKKTAEDEQLLAAADKKVKSKHDELQERTEQIDVTPKSLSAAAAKTQEQYQQAHLDVRARDARRQALEEAIAKLSKQVESSVKDDAVVAELRKVVEIREKEISHKQGLKENGEMSATELDQAVAAAAESRARLLERKRDAAAEAGGNLMQQLNKELLMLSIDSAEQDMRYKLLAMRREALRWGLEQTSNLSSLENDAAKIKTQWETERAHLIRMRNRQNSGLKLDITASENYFFSAPGGQMP